ncbi:MAG: suppressor of fused domain protein [Planctomycetales bacterium]|nr:suppressor of fused domain protein [Planctomycetales bacterium]
MPADETPSDQSPLEPQRTGAAPADGDERYETGDVLLHEASPDGAVQAVVEQDDRVAYFYLHSPRPWFGMRSCWIRNLTPGPAAIDRAEMEQGLPPRLPRTACNHPRGAEPLTADELEVVWFEAGDGAALCLRGEPIAIIPPWSGEGGFHGYARDCREESIVCWPMPNHPALLERIDQARRWWEAWRDEPMWSTIQRQQLASYESYIGPHDQYFQIDGGRWPPKALATFPLPKELGEGLEVIATLGVSIRPQPMVERFTDEPHLLERVELAAIVTPASRMAAAQWLSGTANYPWHHGTWIGAGHTMQREGAREEASGDDAEEIRDKVAFVPHTKLPEPIVNVAMAEIQQAPGNLLFAIPLTEAQWQQFKLTGIDGLEPLLADIKALAW